MTSPIPSPAAGDVGDRIVVNRSLAIPRAELAFRASRAGGPGGQHVNTSSTRVQVTWNVARSPVLGATERARLLAALGSRLDADGTIRVVASDSRSQRQNRDRAEARLADLVRRALVVKKARKPTKPSRAAKEKRLQAKKRQAGIKRQRRARGEEE